MDGYGVQIRRRHLDQPWSARSDPTGARSMQIPRSDQNDARSLYNPQNDSFDPRSLYLPRNAHTDVKSRHSPRTDMRKDNVRSTGMERPHDIPRFKSYTVRADRNNAEANVLDKDRLAMCDYDRPQTSEVTGVTVDPVQATGDKNNHGCGSCGDCLTGVAPCSVMPRRQVVTCPTNPSCAKILAKLFVFLLVLASLAYSLYVIAAGWSHRHEVLALFLLLLVTRLICRKNWFLPAQYWRNLEPPDSITPRQVELTVPTAQNMGL